MPKLHEKPSVRLSRTASSLRILWKWVQLLAVISALLLTPVVIGIMQRYDLCSPIGIIGLICDLLFAADVFLAKFTRARRKRRRPHAYSPSWLLLVASSALVVIPVVYLLGGSPETLAWCCVFRALAAIKLPPLYRAFKQALEKRGMFVHETYVRVVLVFIFAIFYSSMLACAWFSVSCRRQDMRECLLDGHSWVARDPALDIDLPASRYSRSLHFVVQTLFTIGYGDISPVSNREIVFALFLILNGSLFYAFMISSITSLLSNRDATTKLFRSEANVIKDFFVSRGVASDISEQIQGYFDFLFARKKGVLDSAALAAMPAALSLAVRASFAPCLEQASFFQTLSKSGADAAAVSIIRACAEELVFR